MCSSAVSTYIFFLAFLFTLACIFPFPPSLLVHILFLSLSFSLSFARFLLSVPEAERAAPFAPPLSFVYSEPETMSHTRT
jgi:hypothetical protein